MASSESDRSQFLEICDDLQAIAAAAELQLATTAASSLPYRSVVRVFREASRKARLQTGHYGLRDARREEDTEELLGAALGASPTTGDRPMDLDDGPEGSADVLLPIHTEERETEPQDMGAESKVTVTPTPRIEAAPQPKPETKAEPKPAVDLSSLVQFDEMEVTPVPAPAPKVSHLSAPTLVEFDETPQPAPPRSAKSPEVPLVHFDEPPVGEFDDDHATTVGAPVRATETFDLIGEDDDGEGDVVALEEDDEDESGATFVQDMSKLPALADFLGKTRGADDEDRDPSSVAEVIVKKSEVDTVRARTDLSNSPNVPPRPESPRPAAQKQGAPPARPVGTATPRPAPIATRPGESRPAAAAPVPSARSVASVSAVPTVKDSQGIKPRSAAIQLTPTGGKVLSEEEEPLELGEADIDPSEMGDGFSVELVEYESAVEPDDDYEELELQDSSVSQRPVLPTPTELTTLLAQARAEWDLGNFEEAATLFSDALDADPNHLGARIGRGRLALEKGDYTRAMSDFTLAEDSEPNSAEPQVAIGELYFARKD